MERRWISVESLARLLVQRRRLDLLQQLFDHAAYAHDLRRLFDESAWVLPVSGAPVLVA